MIGIEALHHVSVCVTDLARAKMFYGDVLGLAEKPRPDFGFGGAWYQVGSDQELHLIVHDAPTTLRGTTAIDIKDGHLAFRVASYEDTIAHLRAHGVEMLELPRNKTPWAQIYVTDPDGNIIELNVERA